MDKSKRSTIKHRKRDKSLHKEPARKESRDDIDFKEAHYELPGEPLSQQKTDNSYFIELMSAVVKLKPYFTPSSDNWLRTSGLFSAIVLVPLATILMPKFILGSNNDSENPDNGSIDLTTALATASAVALLNAAQEAITTMLSFSTTDAMNRDNVKSMNEPQFLMHGNTKDITSLQYVTVGRAVQDFADNAIPVLIGIPMYITSSAVTLYHIASSTKSYTPPLITIVFVG